MRATLHDELMRDAGFETEYHEALTRRRKTRRARLGPTRALVFRGVLLLLVTAFLLDVFGVVDFLPKWWAGVVSFLGVAALLEVVGQAVRAVFRRLIPLVPAKWTSSSEDRGTAPAREMRSQEWMAP